MPWVKGQSGNPGGRPRLDPAIKEAMRENGLRGITRMRQLLDDETAWGNAGWMSDKAQIALASLAMERAFGKPDVSSVAPAIEAEADRPYRPDLSAIADQLPERRAAAAARKARQSDIEQDLVL